MTKLTFELSDTRELSITFLPSTILLNLPAPTTIVAELPFAVRRPRSNRERISAVIAKLEDLAGHQPTLPFSISLSANHRIHPDSPIPAAFAARAMPAFCAAVTRARTTVSRRGLFGFLGTV